MDAIEYLEWDSNFFNRKIGKFQITSNNDLDKIENVLTICQSKGYDLIYIFTSEHFLLSKLLSFKFDANIVDLKITYTYDIIDVVNNKNFIYVHPFEDFKDLSSLYELAYESGKYSRYKVDKFFSDDEFKSMYSLWIDNSVKGVIADNVFIYKCGTEILGMITLKTFEDVGVIGLLATKPLRRGEGIGSVLTDYAKKYFFTKGIKRLEVNTQKANTGACRFYEKNRFYAVSKMTIYHVWL